MGSNIWTGTTTFSGTANTESIIAVPAPHMGELRSCVLTQTSGTPGGFAAKLYTTGVATPTLPLSHYLIKDLASAGAETAARDLNIAYMNRDGDPTNRPGYVYLRITPVASGNFALSLTVGTPAYL
jgi:hypothetical protein